MSQERILVVDDESIVTEVVQRYLVREGYRVTVAGDGETALELARESGPDLVVLDLMLPKLTASKSAAGCGWRAASRSSC